jgi:Tol biopolymer transport system component
VFVDNNGDIYVSDENNHRVCRWTSGGTFVGWIGGGVNGWQNGFGAGFGNDPSSFNQPQGLFVDDMGILYVADRMNHRVCRWDTLTGNAQGWIGSASGGWSMGNGTGQGNGQGDFNEPWDVFAGRFFFLYVADRGNARISRWDYSGSPQGWIGGGVDGWQFGFGPGPSGDYRSFDSPSGVRVDRSGNIYVAEFQNSRVSKWDTDGWAVGWLGDGTDGFHTYDGASPNWQNFRHFDGPTDIHLDREGYLYVSAWGGRVQKWRDKNAHSIRKIFFFTNRDGNQELYSMNTDGSNQTNLTQNSAFEADFSWSPGVRQILFTSNRDGNDEIYSMFVDGAMQTRLTNDTATDRKARWSKDASQIVFESYRDGNEEIYVMNPDGSGQTRITNSAFWDQDPRWSPDGTRILFQTDRTSNEELYTMDPGGGSLLNLTNDPARDTGGMWSPDGSRIAFVSNRSGNDQIWVMDADGTNQLRVTNSLGADYRPRWHPDGWRILFYSDRNGIGSEGVYVINADGSGEWQVTSGPGNALRPGWSPSGHRIVFQSDWGQPWEIYSVDENGGDLRNLTSHQDEDFGANWR